MEEENSGMSMGDMEMPKSDDPIVRVILTKQDSRFGEDAEQNIKYPIGTQRTGELKYPLEIGEPCIVVDYSTKRAFVTTPVVDITGTADSDVILFTTENSNYYMRYLNNEGKDEVPNQVS